MTSATDRSDSASISVIIPVYNAAPYLETCLDSISRQDISSPVEIILVDDCSSDNSADICRDWMQRQHRITRLIHLDSNRGVSAARNQGLEAASGKYFMFVDADDSLPEQALSVLFEAAESSGVDIVKGNNSIFDDTRKSAARYNVDDTMVIEGDAILADLFEHRKLRGHPWGKLFDRQKFGDIRFPEQLRGSEDLVFCSEAFSRAQSLLLVNKTVYDYRRNTSGSAANKYQDRTYIDWLDAVEKVAGFCHSRIQQRAHNRLMIRTLTQIAREARKLSPLHAPRVLQEIDERRRRWGIGWIALLAGGDLHPGSIGRLAKMYLALYRIRRNLSAS